jgi:signal transduction histidine kinase/ligand-binding sensor domain-containing protein
MTRLRLLALLVVVLGLPRMVMAVSPSTPITQYVHTAWRLEDGLPEGAPRAIAQTKDGYIWIGTEAGVLRFDGIRFIPLDDLAGTALGLSGTVWSLLGASDGSLWIGGSSHLYRWDGVTFSTFSGRLGRYDAIVEDQFKGIWAVRERVMGEREGALCRPAGGTIICLGGRADLFNGYTAAVDSSDAIWAATGRGLVRLLSGAFRTYPFPSKSLGRRQELDGVGALAADVHGGLWVGFTLSGPGLGLEHFQDGHFQHVGTATFNGETLEVNVLRAEKSGDLWIGTESQGILRITGDNVERYDSKSGLSGDSVRQILEDREGDLWVVTSKGIDRFREKSVVTYSRVEGLSMDHTNAALATRDGNVWSTTNTGADVLRVRPPARLTRRVHLPGAEGTSILEARDEAMWIGMDDELYRVAEGVRTRILAGSGRSVGMVARMAEDQQGTVWISTFTTQLDDTILSFVRPNERVAHRFITRLGMSNVTIPDVHSGIWILDRSGNIAHISGGEVQVQQNQLLQQKHPLGMMQDPGGTLYIWCREGLLLIRGAEGRFIADPQLAACQIHQSIFDLGGNLWAGGKCGLLRIQKREVEGWWSQLNAIPQPRLLIEGRDGYDVNWGEFSPTISRSPDGKLWFATKSGLQMVDPAHIYSNTVVPAVVIETFIANHVQVPRSGLEHLPAGTRDFQIEYTALSFPNPAKVLFRYKLDGHDTDWQDVGGRRQAFYTNLGPGHYTFHVIACNDSGVWNKQGTSLSFIIEPAWYQTLWFSLVCAVLSIGLLMAAYRIRARVIADRVELRVNERMSERMRISRELHDTLLQALQGIVLRFSSLTARVSADVQEEMDRSLDDAELLLISGRERIKEMRGTFSQDGNITSDIQGFVTSLFAKQECKVTVEAHGHPIPLNPISHEEILWIAREALTNSCRHSSAAHLTIQVIYTPRNFRLLMEDDGVGLPSDAFLAHYRGHFGLVSMRERADAIGSRFSVRSEGGKGTKVSLSLPARLAYASGRWWLWDLLARRVRRSRT